jgi:hypothetical protein
VVASTTSEADRPEFDVFLAYNSQDDEAVPYVSWINDLLRAKGKKPWFDKADSLVGRSGQINMADGIRASRCCAMFVGPAGLGKHQGRLELPTALRKAIYSDYLLAPVWLPGFDANAVTMPDEISDLTVLDLRKEFGEGELSADGLKKLLAFVARKTPTQYEQAPGDRIESDAGGTAPPESVAPPRERFRALLVGVSAYDDEGLGTLRGPHNDLPAVKLALEELSMPETAGWDVKPLADPTHEQLKDAIGDFFGPSGSETDTLLFYFSGHAIVSYGSHLCARDSDPLQPTWTCVTGQMLAEAVNRSPSRSKIIVLDCCHAAPIVDEDNPYLTLDDHTAVLFASHGPADDTQDEKGLSPFTQSLVRALRDEEAYDGAALTVGALADALAARGQHPRSNAKIARGITLALGPAPASFEPEPSSEHVVLEIDGDDVSEHEERMLRQLAATLDALLASTRDEGRIPKTLVAETIHVLGEDLRRHVVPPRFDQDRDPLPVDLRFRDRKVRQRLSDLPWEYIAMCRHANGDEQRPQDPLRAPALSVQRGFPATPTKSGGGGRSLRAAGRIQRVALFSSLAPSGAGERQHLLTRVSVKRLKAAGLEPEVTAPADWRRFYNYRNDADVFILHVPVHLEHGQPHVRWLRPSGEEDRATPMESIAGALRARPAMTWLLIESVAEDADAESALAVRQLAEYLALQVERPVLAVCHAAAYLRYLGDEDPDGPFAAQVVERLNAGEPLDMAAHAVRHELMTALSPREPAIIGVPMVLSPDERAPSGRVAGSRL